MRAEIRDRNALLALSPIDVRAYLALQGWQEAGRIGDKATVHTKVNGEGRNWEILLPLRISVADYADRLAEVVAALAEVEERNQLAVFADLSASGADVIRLRAPESDDKGTIAIEDGVALYDEAENLMLAAACAVAKPRRRSYHARKINEATDYLETVRLGQTEHGSYVLTLLSPVEPALRRQEALGPEFEVDPFSRQVTRRLAAALKATSDAVTEAIATEDFAAFERAVDHGVSANLCEAISKLAQHGRGLDVGLTWARVRPAPMPNVTRCHFSIDAARILESAAREFRKDEPRLDVTAMGFVVALDRGVDQFDGKATLEILVDDRPRRVKATFEQREYNTIIRAFQNKAVLTLDGDIYPIGQRLELRNPRGIALLEAIEEGNEAGEDAG